MSNLNHEKYVCGYSKIDNNKAIKANVTLTTISIVHLETLQHNECVYSAARQFP